MSLGRVFPCDTETQEATSTAESRCNEPITEPGYARSRLGGGLLRLPDGGLTNATQTNQAVCQMPVAEGRVGDQHDTFEDTLPDA